MNPNIGITAKNLKSLHDLLNKTLADEMILYIKTRKFHWNVSGESFMELHKLFEDQYKQLEKAIDEIAERVGKLGGMAMGTAKEFESSTQLKEAPGKNPSSKEMKAELLKDHETIIKSLRDAVDEADEKFKDAGTADLLTGLMRTHETIAWTLRRYGV